MLPDVRKGDFVRCRCQDGRLRTGFVEGVRYWHHDLTFTVVLSGHSDLLEEFSPGNIEVLYCGESQRHQALMQVEAQHQLAEAIRRLRPKEAPMDEKTEKTEGIVNRNKSAAVQAAKLEAGKIALHRTRDLVARSMPEGSRGFLETPLGALAVANLLDGLVGMAQPDDSPWRSVTQASLTTAYSEALGCLNLDEITKSIFAGITLPGVEPPK